MDSKPPQPHDRMNEDEQMLPPHPISRLFCYTPIILCRLYGDRNALGLRLPRLYDKT